DPDTVTVPYPAVIRSTARHSQLEIGAFQFFERGSTVGCEPSVDDFDHTRLQDVRPENAAVEENRRRMDKRSALGQARLARKETGKMPGDARVPREIMRKRQVHIVAAQKNVIADGDTRELKIAVFLNDADERKIGCPSADIHDENDVSQFDLLAKTVSGLFQPRIKRRLRFFN